MGSYKGLVVMTDLSEETILRLLSFGVNQKAELVEVTIENGDTVIQFRLKAPEVLPGVIIAKNETTTVVLMEDKHG